MGNTNGDEKGNGESLKIWTHHIKLEVIRLHEAVQVLQKATADAKLDTLKQITEAVIGINNMIKKVEINVAMLQVKSGLWGALGGLTAAAVLVAAAYLKTKKGG